MNKKSIHARTKSQASTTAKPLVQRKQCGLCGKTDNLMQTDCCGNWICDDEDSYVLFSFARNSCARNHRRYTLCAFHHGEGHAGSWKDCTACPDSFPTEIYVYYGTNEYNFTKLENPPTFEPTRCSSCQAVIDLAEGGYSIRGDDYYCERCSAVAMQKIFEQAAKSRNKGAPKPGARAKTRSRK